MKAGTVWFRIITTKMKFIDRGVKKLWDFYGFVMSFVSQPKYKYLG
ncbi:hypothetical protein PspMM1_12870 [Pseudoalteromonas sp. MM1]|nr:hypothetical protein PspMM1_12870 [Pseudoalteromonas sp. MM1]